jgi:hypothetical protein|tara:strand:+ start:665 stop:874 length:210 start_codon:yes stop_codon:yes gene_type:complete
MTTKRPSLPNKTTVYINFMGDCGVETVDEYPAGSSTYKQIREDLRNHNMVGGGEYYMSQRSTKDWTEKS